MRSIRQLGVLTLLLPLFFGQASSSHRPTEGKSTRPEMVDYDPNSQKLLLNISLGRPGAHRSANNYKVDVLRRQSGNCLGRCSRPSSEAVVVRSQRICVTPTDTDSLPIHCDETIPAERERMIVTLQHIFTGCYCFRLATYRDDSIRTARQLLERPRFLRTDVIERDVFKWNLSLDLSATSENDLRLFIRPDEDADFDDYHIELFRHEENDADLLSCHETDDPMNEHLTIALDHPFHWMTFHNRSDGYYCVVVIPEDDRCHPPFVDLDKTCARHSNIVRLKGSTTSTILTYHSESTVLANAPFIMTSTALIVIVALLVTVSVLLQGKLNSRQSVVYQHVDGRSAEEIEDVGVLLFYSHADRRLVRHVGLLKRSLQHSLPSCRLFDDGDDAESLATEGIEWFSNRLGVANICIVIILCQQMIRCQKWLESKEQVDGPIDRDCCMRLDLLTRNLETFGNEYNRIFAVYFDDLQTTNEKSICLLTPNRSYRWPTDQDALLYDLRHTKGYPFSDTLSLQSQAA